MDIKVTAIVLFALTYLLLLLLPKYRAYVALGSAVLFVVLGILPFNKVWQAVDWNVLLMIAGTMGLVSLFIESKMPARLGDLIIAKVPNVKWAVIGLSLFAGLISAFVDNVATVLMIAPVAINICKRLKISPVPSIIAIAISSNLQGAATLVGDTTSILLGGEAGLDFFDFFVFQGKMGMFWVVQISAIAATAVLYIYFKDYNQPIHTENIQEVEDYFPTFLLVGMVGLLIAVSFIPADSKPAITNGLLCTVLMIVGIVRDFLKNRNPKVVKNTIEEIDFFTLLLLGGLFVVIGGITEAGVVDEISKLFVKLSGDNLFIIYSLLVWFSVLVSAFIDNIPYVATMLPVVTSIAAMLNVSPFLLYFGLLSGATLGGNLTPIGASANITALGILRKEGQEVKTTDFMKMSVPFTLSAVMTGYILVWFIWK